MRSADGRERLDGGPPPIGLNEVSFRNQAPRIQSTHAVRNDMDRFGRLKPVTSKRRFNARSQHGGAGFNPCSRIHSGSNDGSILKAFSQEFRYSREIINRGKWNIEVAEAKDSMYEHYVHWFLSIGNYPAITGEYCISRPGDGAVHRSPILPGRSQPTFRLQR